MEENGEFSYFSSDASLFSGIPTSLENSIQSCSLSTIMNELFVLN